jgi:hypothetical protein
MDQNFPKHYDDSERRFLKNQAQELRNGNQPCELHTRTQGSLYRGRVLEADEGGIVFQRKTADAWPCRSRLSRSLSASQFHGARRPATRWRAVPRLVAPTSGRAGSRQPNARPLPGLAFCCSPLWKYLGGCRDMDPVTRLRNSKR